MLFERSSERIEPVHAADEVVEGFCPGNTSSMRNGITATPALTALSISLGIWGEAFDFEEKTNIMTRQL
jgi:hypothetical protein